MKFFISSFIFLILVSCGGDAGSGSASATANSAPSNNQKVSLDCEMVVTKDVVGNSEGKKSIQNIDLDLDREEATWNYTSTKFTTNPNNPKYILSINNNKVELGELVTMDPSGFHFSINRNDFSATMMKKSLQGSDYDFGINAKGTCKVVEREAPKGF